MKIGEKIIDALLTHPVLKVIRIIVGWIMTVLGGLLAAVSAFCALAALFGGLELDSFGDRTAHFALYFVLACISVNGMVNGIWIKNGNIGKKRAKPVAQAVPKATPKTDLPQPTGDQKRLHEIEQRIDAIAGAVMANPMSPGTRAYNETIIQLQQEKNARLRRIASHMTKITAQDAWKTFTPEQQKRFDAQVYQYSQDVGRDGILPREVYAENRGLVFVDGRPVPKEVAARLKELQEAAASEEERKNTMVKAFDYPVPFTELLIHPNRIVPGPKSGQILHEDQTASYGTLYKEKVSLCEENGQHMLICEKQERGEHGSQWDMEYSMIATLSMNPQQFHYIPLTKWILSLQWKNLRQYTDEVCVRQPVAPAEHLFQRYRRIKESRMKNSHDQYGWNCISVEIGLGFDSPDVWHLCGTSHWREMPSGLPYDVTIVMKLMPRVEKESEETLCGLLYSLPWWDPNEADRKMHDVRNWLDADYLRRQEAAVESLIKSTKNPSGYEEQRNEIQRQLSALDRASKPVQELQDMKKTLTFMPTFRSDLKAYRMDMHTDSGEKFCFVLSGMTAFHPNRSSQCGYGSDDWFFHCSCNNEDYILSFSDEASYGTCWSCAVIAQEDAGQLAQLTATDWMQLMTKSKKCIHHLHPDHAAAAKAAMKITASRCGPISDKAFYGL